MKLLTPIGKSASAIVESTPTFSKMSRKTSPASEESSTNTSVSKNPTRNLLPPVLIVEQKESLPVAPSSTTEDSEFSEDIKQLMDILDSIKKAGNNSLL